MQVFAHRIDCLRVQFNVSGMTLLRFNAIVQSSYCSVNVIRAYQPDTTTNSLHIRRLVRGVTSFKQRIDQRYDFTISSELPPIMVPRSLY